MNQEPQVLTRGLWMWSGCSNISSGLIRTSHQLSGTPTGQRIPLRGARPIAGLAIRADVQVPLVSAERTRQEVVLDVKTKPTQISHLLICLFLCSPQIFKVLAQSYFSCSESCHRISVPLKLCFYSHGPTFWPLLIGQWGLSVFLLRFWNLGCVVTAEPSELRTQKLRGLGQLYMGVRKASPERCVRQMQKEVEMRE